MNAHEIQYPPLQLIKTWVWMMTESDNPMIRDKGRDNLITSFGSLAKANEYLMTKLKEE